MNNMFNPNLMAYNDPQANYANFQQQQNPCYPSANTVPTVPVEQLINTANQTISNLQSENMALKNKIEIEKAFEEPRRFSTDHNGNAVSIEPNKKIKNIGNFIVNKVTKIISEKNVYCSVNYSSDSNVEVNSILIPEKDLYDRKIKRYFPLFHFSNSISGAIVNNFLYEKITCFPDIKSIHIPSFAGFYPSNNNELSFFSGSSNISAEIKKIIPEKIRNKKLDMDIKLHSDELTQWLMKEDQTKLLLHLCRFIAIISPILKSANISFQKILILSGNNPDINKFASCFLQVYNRPNLCSTSLNNTETQINKVLSNANCEVALFNDDMLLNNDIRQTRGLTLVHQCFNNFNTSDTATQNSYIIAIASNAASSILPPEETMCINISNEFMPNYNVEILSTIFSQIDAYAISNVCNGFKEFIDYLQASIFEIESKLTSLSSASSKRAYAIILGIMDFFDIIFHLKLSEDYKKEFETYLCNIFVSSIDEHSYCDNTIVNQFSKVLNTNIQNGKISVIHWNKKMLFENDHNIVVLKDNLLLIEESTIKNIILSQMNLIDKFSVLTTALKNTGLLHCTKGQRYTSTMYRNGSPFRTDLFAVLADDILESNVFSMISSVNDTAFFNNNNCTSNLLPLIQDINKLSACQLIDVNNNRHLFVSGKSGYGKSTFLIQLAASYCNLGETVLIFDKNDSFTKSNLIRLLSKDFVERNVQFYNTDEKGFPINPFPDFNYDNKNTIIDILSSPFHGLSQRQLIAIDGIMQKYLSTHFDPSILEMICPQDECNWINGVSEHSIIARIQNLINNLYRKEAVGDWRNLIHNSQHKKIIVVSMPNVGEVVNQLIDLMLASFFNWRMTNSNDNYIHLFLDEIQSQNLYDDGSICRFLKEGRKYHVSLNCATQEYTRDHKDVCRISRQAATKVFFKPDEDSLSLVAKSLYFKPNNYDRLINLKKFECIVKGEFFNFTSQACEETTLQGTIYRHDNSI